jgi:hypothetical protein
MIRRYHNQQKLGQTKGILCNSKERLRGSGMCALLLFEQRLRRRKTGKV